VGLHYQAVDEVEAVGYKSLHQEDQEDSGEVDHSILDSHHVNELDQEDSGCEHLEPRAGLKWVDSLDDGPTDDEAKSINTPHNHALNERIHFLRLNRLSGAVSQLFLKVGVRLALSLEEVAVEGVHGDDVDLADEDGQHEHGMISDQLLSQGDQATSLIVWFGHL